MDTTSRRNSRKKRPVNEPVDLKAKLREKMMLHKLGRTKQVVLDKEIDDIEDKLENTKLRGREKKKLQERLRILEEIEQKRVNSINDDYAEYVDGATYGGGFEHPD